MEVLKHASRQGTSKQISLECCNLSYSQRLFFFSITNIVQMSLVLLEDSSDILVENEEN